MRDLYLVAEIIGFDKRGFAKLKLYTDFIEKFSSLNSVFIEVNGNYKSVKIEQAKITNETVLLKFADFKDKDDFEVLNGRKLYIDNTNLMPLPEDEYYIHDLIGMTVRQNDKVIGKVKDVIKLKSNDVLEIECEEGEKLIPFVSDFVGKVDIKKKLIFLTERDINFYDED